MSLENLGAITLFVDDLEASATFYRDAFELKSMHEDEDSTAFDFGNTILNLLRTPAADELITPAKVGDGKAGARCQLTIEVDDVDATCAQLSERGVELLNGPIDRPWGVRTAAFADPSGHVWEIAHNLPSGDGA